MGVRHPPDVCAQGSREGRRHTRQGDRLPVVAAPSRSEEEDLMAGRKKMPKLGTGKRFAAVEASAAKSGARNPAAVAAAAGRKKFGAKKMAALAKTGARRARRK